MIVYSCSTRSSIPGKGVASLEYRIRRTVVGKFKFKKRRKKRGRGEEGQDEVSTHNSLLKGAVGK